MKRISMGLVCLGLVGNAISQTLWFKSGPINTSSQAVRSMSARSIAPNQQETVDGTICLLVQFAEPPDDADREQLEALGCEIVGYVPDHALLVLIDSSDRAVLKTVPDVQWVGDCLAEYKLSSDLDFTQSELEVVVSLFKPGFLEPIEWWIERQAGTVVDSGRGASRATIRTILPASAVKALAERAEVEWIESFVQPQLHNNMAVEAPCMNVKTVWETHGLTGHGQVVAIADSGLDSGDPATIHSDFEGRIRFATSWVYGDDWKDYNGHGTHVAGSVLGSGAASSNLYRGVAYEAELVMQAAGNRSGSGSIYLPSALDLVFEQAYTNGARIHQNSWGGGNDGAYTTRSRSVDDFMWEHDDMLIVFSAGNSGVDVNADGVVDLQSLGVPASAKNCLTVGAAESGRPAASGGYTSVTEGEKRPLSYPVNPIRGDLISSSFDGVHQGIAAFSSRGPCADGRIKPDVVAPGTDIISCRAQHGRSTLWGTLSGEAGDYYLFSGGTSMAAPLVSGLAALTRQYFQDVRGVSNPSAALMKAAIINGAVSLYPGQYGTGEWVEVPNTTGNMVEGWGQVNAGNTFYPDGKQNVFWDRNRLQTDEDHVFNLDVDNTNGLSVTLVWTDPPASLLSSKQLVNDLDLMLLSPSGVTNYANGLSGADHTNNVEQIDLATCETGRWTMVVSGYDVPNGQQPYALFSAFSGDVDESFEVTYVWHEPTDVIGADEPVELFASLTTGGRDLAVAAMAWRKDGGDWNYEPLSLVQTNGENLVYSSSIDVGGVGVVVDYYAYAFSYDMELVMSLTNSFDVDSSVLYVSLDGSQTWPYDSFETAYTNLNEALDAARAGITLRVGNGVYNASSIVLQDDIALSSVNGPESTVLDFTAQNGPALSINDGLVCGFTIQGGFCITFNASGGVTMRGGSLSNCWVRGNSTTGYGGGVYQYDGLVTHCRIESNTSGTFGGGVLIKGGLLEQSVIADNVSDSDAGGIEVWGGTIRNCTVVGNESAAYGGGIDIGDTALIENCIVVSNSAVLGGDDWYAWWPMNMRYTCTAPLYDGIGNINMDPLFVDAAGGDYHLQSSYGHFTTNGWVLDRADSPCIDFGSPDTDASNESTGCRINMGAYGNTAEASRSGTNETRLIVQAAAGSTDPDSGLYLYSPAESATVSLIVDPYTIGSTQLQFSAWTLDDGWRQTTNTAESVSCSMTNNWIVRAVQDVYYRVDLSAGGNGRVSFTNGWFAAGSNLTVTAVPDRYYAFDGWSGTLSTDANPLEMVLSQPLELLAAFSLAYTSNGVPQWWLGQYGLTNDFEAASVSDPDGDGALTWEEYIAGTLPTDSDSVLQLSLDQQSGTNLLCWTARAGRTYTLYYGSDLSTGLTNVLVNYYSIFPWTIQLPDSVNTETSPLFYRLDVEYND